MPDTWVSLDAVRAVVTAAPDLDLSVSEMAVLIQLAISVNDKDTMQTWQTTARIVERSKVSRAQVTRALASLQRRGLIEFVRFQRSGVKEYRITLSNATAKPAPSNPAPKTNPAPAAPREPHAKPTPALAADDWSY